MAGINLSSGFNASLEKPLDLRTVVQDLTERDNIDSVKRYDGLEVYVIDEQTKYRLEGGTDNSDWVETGGTNINSIDDINDVSISSVSSGNLLKYDGSDWVNVEKSTIDIGEFNDDGTYLSSIPTLQEVTEQGNTTDQTVQITGLNNSPSSGKGIEIGYLASSDYARIRSDDRDNRIFKPLILQGSKTRIQKGDVSIEDGNLKVDGTGDSYIKGSLGLGGITDPSEALEVDGNGKFSGNIQAEGSGNYFDGTLAVNNTDVSREAANEFTVSSDLVDSFSGFNAIYNTHSSDIASFGRRSEGHRVSSIKLIGRSEAGPTSGTRISHLTRDARSESNEELRISVGTGTPSEVLSIISNNKVGINTAYPSEALDVDGNIAANEIHASDFVLT